MRGHIQLSSPAKAGDPVFQRRQWLNREAAAYWIARSSRAMTRGGRLHPHNSLAFENANDDTRRVFSSKISVRVIGGSARWLQFSRSQSRQLTPIGVPS